MKNLSTMPLVITVLLGLAMSCTARNLQATNLFFPHGITITTSAAPPPPPSDDGGGDKPYTAIDSIFTPSYSGYLSTTDRLKYFAELIRPNLQCDAKGGCSFQVCNIETVETDCEQCSDQCIQIHHASICLSHKKVCTTNKCSQSKQVCRSPGEISGGIKAAGVPIKVMFHVPVDGSNTPYWGVTEARLKQMLDEANSLLAKTGLKLVLGVVDYFRASKADVTASTGGKHGFTDSQVALLASRRQGSFRDLNVWLVETTKQQNYGAFGTFPHLTTMGKQTACEDGIFVKAGELRAAETISGTLLVHEMGHWLQLFHTFREDDRSAAVQNNIALAKRAVKSGELCTMDSDSEKLKTFLPQIITGREGFGSDVPLSTPHQPLSHLNPDVLALPGWDGFSTAQSSDPKAMANYKALGCGGVAASKPQKSCANQDGPDDYSNLMDYMPDTCRTVFTAQQIAVMHTAYRIRQDISINGKTDKFQNMKASRCLTGA